MEVWKDISGFENYQISNYGNVKASIMEELEKVSC